MTPSEPAPPAPAGPAGDPAEVLAALRAPATDTATAEKVGTAALRSLPPRCRWPPLRPRPPEPPAAAPTPLVGSGSTPPPDTVRIPSGTTAPSGRNAGRIIALVLVVALLGYLGWWFTNRSTDDNGNATPAANHDRPVGRPTTPPRSCRNRSPSRAPRHGPTPGVACEPGKSFELVASGTVFHDPTNGVGPDGSSNATLRQFNLPGLSDANHGALVASLDAKAPFTVVGDSATYTCAAAGELFLGPNDSGVDNNHGEWAVTVTPSG